MTRPTGSAFKTDLANSSGAGGTGAFLAGYQLNPLLYTVGRDVQNKLDDWVSAKDFGLATTNTVTQNVTALQNSVNFARDVGGATIHIPRGIYDFNESIDFTATDNIRLTGDGINATILRITSATAHFFTQSGTTNYQTFDNFTLTSTVTRTAGAMFRATFMKYGMLDRIKITRHFNGIDLAGFVQTTIRESFIVDPSGAGTSLIVGARAATNTGANLTVMNCFFRGNDDVTNNAPTSNQAVELLDVEAAWFINNDMGSYKYHIMLVDPQTNVANCFFLQNFFDGTQGGDHVRVQGAGTKNQFQFTGCWFNGAGAFSPGTNDCFSMNLVGSGQYYAWNITGCRFYTDSGSAVYADTQYLDFNFTGCNFYNVGYGGGSFTWSMHFHPTAGAAVKFPIIVGCKFDASLQKSILFDTNSSGGVVTGCWLSCGIQLASGVTMAACSGNSDPSNVGTINSAATLVVPPTTSYIVVLGTTNITTITPTFQGHQLSIRFVAVLTVSNGGGNIRLNGSNYTTGGGSLLTLVCESNGDWREISRTN